MLEGGRVGVEEVWSGVWRKNGEGAEVRRKSVKAAPGRKRVSLASPMADVPPPPAPGAFFAQRFRAAFVVRCAYNSVVKNDTFFSGALWKPALGRSEKVCRAPVHDYSRIGPKRCKAQRLL